MVSFGEAVAPANLALASGPELRIANPQRDPVPANPFLATGIIVLIDWRGPPR
jgi:hypothetical protein